ncbi:MAG TPA: DUF2065 family protein [Dokdonella sp.]|uniref:DUF2065 family protein n=1 Tax=Dokdonella sp. TaxID=2291710 RepID=UPI0025BD0775|nr:DUF2065 family protein [Dokdonella sp.]MBX3693497.1 DUF2065 family protein [Dokdonella sp.]MCW5567902.1 DUF2065 family protein [Dokdonella sp.]HNR92355.1 DUF2065 family protein [Dokdonella sp.]
MSADLAAALCLVLVLEGLLLFAAPGAWKRMAEQLQRIDERRLRLIGGIFIVVGLVALRVIR